MFHDAEARVICMNAMDCLYESLNSRLINAEMGDAKLHSDMPFGLSTAAVLLDFKHVPLIIDLNKAGLGRCVQMNL